ncbi:MAG: hypothetical protein ABJZ55_11380 [Fuerstiella sp.]
MKKFKPFLVGAVAGSLLMFVSLQFHLIRSEDGFRLVPRTPQPSIGLFFVDLRNWTPEDYADRPELARALVAHGDTDLVASSVSDELLGRVSGSESALEQLRGLMNEDGAMEGLQIPGTIPEAGGQDGAGSSNEFEDLLKFPFGEAKQPSLNQIARIDELNPSGGRLNLPSADSIFGPESGNQLGVQERPDDAGIVSDPARVEPLDPFRESTSRSAPFSESINPVQPTFTASEESDLISDMLFGDDDEGPVSSTPSSGSWQDTVANSRESVTNEVRKEVASRVDEVANGFRGQLQRTREQAFDQTLETIEDYSARKVQEALPGAVGDFFRSDSSLTPLPTARSSQSPISRLSDVIPPELEALQRGFDPFLK